MTPQERQLVDDLFDRLARLETAPRDPDAEQAIAEGLRRAPNAVYALVQTALVQDEALRRADARIRELSGASEAAPSGGFLDSMRAALTSHAATSVPSVRSRTANEPDPRWNSGGAYSGANTAGGQYGTAPGAMAPQSQGGGSFLGTAAASAAGMIGGALLLNSISSMFGHHGGSAFADAPFGGAASPWDNSTSSASGSDLARDAGLNDIGNAGAGTDPGGAGLFGGGDDLDTTDVAGLGDDFGGDGGGGDGGGGDSA